MRERKITLGISIGSVGELPGTARHVSDFLAALDPRGDYDHDIQVGVGGVVSSEPVADPIGFSTHADAVGVPIEIELDDEEDVEVPDGSRKH